MRVSKKAHTLAKNSEQDKLVLSQRSFYAFAVKQFLGNKFAIVGAILVLAEISIAVFAPLIAPYDPLAPELENKLLPLFSPGHILGTDDLGRDMLSRMIYGARISAVIGAGVVIIAASIAIPTGAIAGYFPIFDKWISFGVNILLAFPGILLALAMAAALGPGLFNVMVAIGIHSMPMYIRVIRAQVLVNKERDYVMAARSVGVSEMCILFRHILPNCVGPIIVQATINMGTGILHAAALSFLGIGVQPPIPEWGAMLSQSRLYIVLAPHIVALPGLAIMSVVLGFNLLGDGLRDALDPRLKR